MQYKQETGKTLAENPEAERGTLTVPEPEQVTLGKNLLLAAKTEYDKNRTNKVINRIQAIMLKRDAAVHAAKLEAEKAAIYNKQLAALEQGNFTMDDYTGDITFTDSSLNRVKIATDAHGNAIYL